MKFTLAWLKDHLDTDAPLQRITDTLTAIGLELEDVHDPSRTLAPFVVAHVLEAEPHPNADRLRVCKVATGTETVQVICGAPNARAGMKGVFAPSGTTIPGTGLLLKPSLIRGVESNGMLCSEREMGLSDEHDGIIDLPDDAPVGQPFAAFMGLDDPVIDVAVTPNRQDCLGVRGIARDLAAAGLGTLRPFEPAPVAGGYDSPIRVRLEFPDGAQDACPCFVGRHFRGLTNGPSPAWMQRRLRAIGLRPISALVDVTNYLTYDLGRPLHVFDADKVSGDIHARLGRPGETLLALNGKEYAIDGDMTVIADDAGPEGLGGVMGGEHTGCTGATTAVFLEVALFDPKRTARTGRKLAIDSDARHRFERGVDPGMVLPGAEYATRLVLDVCGGEASRLVVAGTPEVPPRRVAYRPHRLAALAGLDLAEAEQRTILEALGYRVDDAGDGTWQTVPATWRSDVHGEADLIEDIARIAGYDRIPAVPLPRDASVAVPSVTPAQRRTATARRVLAGRGSVECVTYSFLPRRQAELFAGGNRVLKVANPIADHLDAMRPSALPNLIAAAGRNVDRGFADLALFEVGPRYRDETPDGQDTVAAGIRRGRTARREWTRTARPVDAFDAKADALALLAGLGVQAAALQTTPDAPVWFHPGRSGSLRQGQRVLAWFGELHPRVLEEMDVAGPLVGFEAVLDLVPLPRAKTKARPKLELIDFPAVERDFAFVVDETVAADHIIQAIRKVERNLIAAAWPFDVYRGAGVPEGHKSVAVTVRLEPRERTLTDAEIDAVAERIVAAVAKATGGTLRS